MKRHFSHGSSEQMLAAFQNRINELRGADEAVNTSTESGTEVQASQRYVGYNQPYGRADAIAYLNGKLEFYGNEIEMDFGDGLKLAKYLHKRGKQVYACPSEEIWSIPGQCHWTDCYFYPYEANLEGCEDNTLWDGESDIVESATSLADSNDVKILPRDEDPYVEVENDETLTSRYIHALVGDVNAQLESSGELESWSWEDQSDEEKLVLTTVSEEGNTVNEYEIPYADLTQSFDTLEQDVSYITGEVLGQLGDGREVITESTEVKAGIFEFGAEKAAQYGDLICEKLSGKTISKRKDLANEPGGLIYEAKQLGIDMWDLLEALEGLCRLRRATEIDDSTYQVLGCDDNGVQDSNVPVEGSFSYGDEDEWKELASKSVLDSDGFYTDYTLYMRKTEESPQYVCVFGDRDIYRPTDGEYDYECDDEDEALEWFESYNGFEDDDLYSATALYQNPYDEDDEDIQGTTVADNGEQVFQLMEYSSDPEAGIEGDDFYCYGEFFATDEDDALKQLEEAKSAYPKFANLADRAHLFVQPYNEHFSTEGEIYQNVSAIAQHLNQDFHNEEIPFA